MTAEIGTDGYHLMTAEIVVQTGRRKDNRQTLVWRDFDQVPDLPRLKHFLDFWARTAGSELCSVTVTQIGVDSEPAHRLASMSFTVH